MRKLFFALYALAFIGCAGPDRSIPSSFDYGHSENGLYENEYFELKIPFNPEWSVQSTDQMNQLAEMGGKALAGDDKNMEAVLEASKINTAYLLAVFQHEMGTAVTSNPSFMSVAENIKNFPGLKDGSDYLFHTKELLKQTQMQYNYEKDVYKKTIGSKDFYVMEVSVDQMGVKMHQEYFCTLKNDFALAFVMSYSTEDEKAELYKIIDAIEI